MSKTTIKLNKSLSGVLNSQRIRKPPRSQLTTKRRAILQQANDHPLGLIDNPYHRGFEAVAWRKNASWLVERGHLQPYVHGGFEITDAGRVVLVLTTPQPRRE